MVVVGRSQKPCAGPGRSRSSGGLLVVALLCATFAAPAWVFLGSSTSSPVKRQATALSASRASFVSSPLHESSRVRRGAELLARRAARSTPADFDLSGKVALVTGASRGIGAAIAQKLAAAGATVIGTATSDGGAQSISSRFVDGLKGEGMKLDVTDPSDVDAFMKAVEAKYGAPDILVNNAGITKDGLMMRMKDDQWNRVIETNLNSIFRMTKAALKGMTKKRWGRIISISSVVGSSGNPGQANYAAAKAGVDGFSRALAREVGPRGVTVNTVAPGFIATDMTEGLKDEWKAKLLESVPAERLGTPDEVAGAVLYLASPSAAYVTGLTMHVNGGMYMR
eukprot:TRINITY_DN26006_c0_g1_i1.p1 TRINITY_DN26006_c0_g1~~TRINITY_DN26006_c0_g1_i1.p1  ORF type:complete len:355 (-),score=63.46 TRINITY_DN26006_c0_g1_i1:171-1187(-)